MSISKRQQNYLHKSSPRVHQLQKIQNQVGVLKGVPEDNVVCIEEKKKKSIFMYTSLNLSSPWPHICTDIIPGDRCTDWALQLEDIDPKLCLATDIS
ncbi:hypothetical protein AG1IA_00642 [Rhizoctonia solani AG-1 IA]|uniref:Uncharacterized protein n=1 Tax=Thanatephorus cucumeris (strain AG1-IA) TaxID=983506 RepID=L8X9H4_THACA|nr:hypothetical protein AG1IA_00642 [Rhizoctonia solani AG-1 IA]